jgi:aryl-alcohol dehydrogenase-like predicted oxidoreductase
MTIDRRPIGHTDIEVSPVALGGWPITGITSLDVNEADNLATVRACLDHGINFVDTAYCYGANGESEMLIRRALGERRNEMVIATKAGVHWEPDGSQTHDGRPETLKRECEESLRRLGTDCVDLLYQHRPDPDVPVAESAGALHSLMESGKTRSVGVSNFGVEHLEAFHAVCPISAYQPCYNMLQREIEASTLPWCREHGVSVMVYWPLMLGLLAGKLQRDHVFPARDGRAKYPMFQNEEYRKNLDFVDRLREVADEAGKTVAQVVINWTIHQVGITVAICGAKRADQVADNAGGMNWQLSSIQLAQINRVLEERGEPVTISPSPAMSARADGTPGRVE